MERSSEGDVREIPLGHGLSTLVDGDTYDRVAHLDWKAINPSGKHPYAARWIPETRKWELLHRVILNTPEGMIGDHVNGDTLDNRRANLRNCTKAQNAANLKGPYANNKSGYIGVHRHRKNGTWIAQVRHKGVQRYLGSFATPEEAARARDGAARELHGEFATLNFDEREEAAV